MQGNTNLSFFVSSKNKFLIFIFITNKMSNLSLNASIRTCKVETGQANRIESDRFLNPNNMVCIPWNGINSKGQSVCPDSKWTKTAGCNSASDRVTVENHLRPDYATYINLNTAGIQGDIYGPPGNPSAWAKAGAANSWLDNRNNITGNFGKQFASNVYPTCGINAYKNGMSQEAQARRAAGAASNGYWANAKRAYSGSCQ